MPIATVNPATGELIRQFEPLPDSQIEEKIQLAAATFSHYCRLSFAERRRMMLNAAQILESEKEKFGRLMTTEMGKTLKSAVEEAAKCAWACRHYADNAERFLADEIVETTADKSFICYQPIGPVLAVMPWNFPFWQVFRFAAPALMAGNVGLLKHASNVPQCALAIEDVFRRAGFPEGAFQTLLISAQKVDKILADPRVVAATLTGSEAAGVEVGTGAAKRIKKVVLELGGSDPFIVMPSADFDEAVATAVKARIINNGQSCIAAKRFIVADEIAGDFEREFVRRMEALKIGDPMEESTELGPLSTADGVRDLHTLVQQTVAAGAKLLTGGKKLDRPGNFYAPTVLTNIPKNAPAYREELFGPAASIFRAKDVDDAIRIANDSRFGLGASAWTNDEDERQRFINELESGMVFINRMVASDPRLPFGGVKQSGYGRELSVHGIREFTNIKTVWIQEPAAKESGQRQARTIGDQSVYKAVQTSRLYEQIVQQIEDSIRNGTLKAGDQLPAERELAQRFGVSRTAVREAVKALREKGLVEAYSGRGTFVTNGTSQAIRQSLDRIVKVGQPEGSAHLTEVREILEPEIAAMAAARADEQHIAAMREAVAVMDKSRDDADAFIEADLDFHLALAEGAGNPVILWLIDSIVGLLREQRMRTFHIEGGPERGQFHHKRILDAVEKHDPETARQAMRSHLQQVRDDSQVPEGEPALAKPAS